VSRPPGTFILPMCHPAKFFRSQTNQFTAELDWEKAIRIQKEGPTIVHPPFEDWQWRPTVDHVESYFSSMGTDSDCGPWSIDFEATVDRRIVCLGLWSCHNPLRHRGLCIPFLSQGGVSYWNPQDEQYVMGLVRSFFTDPSIGKIGHNAAGYDLGVTPFNKHSLIKQAWGIDVQGFIADTMVMHHTAFCELRHSLAFCSSISTDLGPYKEELWEEDGQDEEEDDELDWTRILDRSTERVTKYCLKDVFVQTIVYNGLVMELS